MTETRLGGVYHPVSAWRRLADAINDRAQELGLQQRDIAERSGMSVGTIRSLQRAERTRRNMHARDLERALLWQAGSVTAVLAGGDPAPIVAEPAPATTETRIDVDVPHAERLTADELRELEVFARGMIQGWVAARVADRR